MDTLRNQIIERKSIDLILQSAVFKDVPYELEIPQVDAVDASLAGGDAPEIPEVSAPSAAQ